MSMRIYTHPACLAHDTGPGHAERPQRLSAVTEALQQHFHDLDWHEAPRATRGQLLRAHHESLLTSVLETRPSERIMLDPDTVLSPASAEAALRAAGAAIAATDAVLSGDVQRTFCAVRPPGHHATIDVAMGFCLFNSIAVAAAHALEQHGLARVAIVDFDVHHGNGTQAIFYERDDVLFISLHADPDRQYPYFLGGADERGEGAGEGFNVNYPLPIKTTDAQFLETLSRACDDIARFAPNYLVVSLGVDTFGQDPLGDFAMTADAYPRIGARLARLNLPTVFVMEGGYAVEQLGRNVVRVLAGFWKSI